MVNKNLKNKKSNIKGTNYEVKYKFTDISNVINEDFQTILAKDENEAIEEVKAYLESLDYVNKDTIEIIETSIIFDESLKKCYKVTYTWEDDKGNVSKLSEKVFSKDPEQAKK